METRWLFHRMEMPLDGVPHFDMLHPARRLWKPRPEDPTEGGCRLQTLERTLFDVRRVGDVPGFEIPARFFQFLRSGDPRPLEPVLEHNRLDLVSLAAVTARAVQTGRGWRGRCPDEAQALALGRIYERAGLFDRAEACYRRGATCESIEVRGESLYRLGLRCRRDRRFSEAATHWRELLALTEPRSCGATPPRPPSGSSPSRRWRSITSIASVIWRSHVSWRCSLCRRVRKTGETAVAPTGIVTGSRG